MATHRKFTPAGKQLWYQDHGTSLPTYNTSLAFDSLGRVVTLATNGTIKRWSSNGASLSLSIDNGASPSYSAAQMVATNSADDIIVTHTPASSVNMRSYDVDGNIQWYIDTFSNTLHTPLAATGLYGVIRAIAVDQSDDSIYVSFYYQSSPTVVRNEIHKYDSSGAFQWAIDVAWLTNSILNMTAMRFDSVSGNLYAGGGRRQISSGPDVFASLFAIDGSDGSVLWSVDTGTNVTGVAVNGTAGEVYAINASSGTNAHTFRCYNTSGSLQWSHSFGAGITTIYSAVETDGTDFYVLKHFGGSFGQGIAKVEADVSSLTEVWDFQHGDVPTNGPYVDGSLNPYLGGWRDTA